jgi:hypothetical protein
MVQRDAAQDLDLQAKCSSAAKSWFSDAFGRDRDTILLHYTNHYNKSQNRCFALVEWHYTTNFGPGSWTNHMSLGDVYENSQYGDFAAQHINSVKPTYTQDIIAPCEVLGVKCKSADEFDNMVQPYLEK